jgi:hypothetical protein
MRVHIEETGDSEAAAAIDCLCPRRQLVSGQVPDPLNSAICNQQRRGGRREYEQVGVRQIFVLDPETHAIYRWKKGLVESTDLELANGVIIAGEIIWNEFECRMNA